LITFFVRIPQSRLLLVQTKIYQRPPLPNSSPVCKRSPQSITTLDSVGRREIFSVTFEKLLSAEKNRTTKLRWDERLLSADGVGGQNKKLSYRWQTARRV